MTTKFYTAKSNANRALKKAISGYEAFVAAQAIEQDEQGFYGHIVLKSGAGRHLQEFLQEKGMEVELGVAEAPAPTLAEEKAAAQPMGEKDLPAEDKQPAEEAPAADEDDDDVAPEVIAAALADQFRRQFAELGGNAPRGRCKALRALAASWDGSRKEFIDAAVANGILASTANANYQAGYSK